MYGGDAPLGNCDQSGLEHKNVDVDPLQFEVNAFLEALHEAT
jgi:hypothetical protein